MAESGPAASYVEIFGKGASKKDPEWLVRLRKDAIAEFGRLGFPRPSEEAWKYTDLAPLAERTFVPGEFKGNGIDALHLAALRLDSGTFPEIVVVNGRVSNELSNLKRVPKGVRVLSLAETLAKDPELVRSRLGKTTPHKDRAFVALNTAFFSDGVLIDVAPQTVVENLLHILFVAASGKEPPLISPRVLVNVGQGAEASLVESFGGWDANGHLTNAVTEIALDADSALDHYRIEREHEKAFHIGAVDVRQARGSRYTSHSMTFGGGLVRNDVNTVFEGEGGEATLNGLFVPTGNQHVDNHTIIDHRAPHCTSRELYKGILDGKSRGVFYGKVYVRKDAQKTDASQVNKNLLLSEDALVDSTPALEILADDVKCSHASTIGQLDRDALFYLTTRGLDERSAKSLMIYAFARDVVDRVKPPAVRQKLDAMLASRLPKAEVVREAL